MELHARTGTSRHGSSPPDFLLFLGMSAVVPVIRCRSGTLPDLRRRRTPNGLLPPLLSKDPRLSLPVVRFRFGRHLVCGNRLFENIRIIGFIGKQQSNAVALPFVLVFVLPVADCDFAASLAADK